MLATECLDRALEVERFIASCRTDGEHGALWQRTAAPDSGRPHTFYHGSAGIALYYLELHAARGNPSHLAEAVSAGEELLGYLAGKSFVTVAFHTGWPGYVFVLNELFRATGEVRFRDGARQALQKLADQAQPLGCGIGWVEPMPFSDITGKSGDREIIDLSVGAAGAGVIFVYAHREGLHDQALRWARQTADRLLEVAEQTPDGPRWLMMADMPFSFTAPNFAHGGAGVAYLLADLYRETGESRYLDAAIGGARYVMSRAVPSGDGHLVCHNEEQQPPRLFYLGVCHGPAGTGRLMYLLNQITGEPDWLDWLHGNVDGLLATGAPEVRSDGLWQNLSQCCGDAGIGDYALYLYRATGRAGYLDLARRIASYAIEASETADGARCWAQAEHRTRPDFVERQTGYMQGAAGVGSFLLHLATCDDTRPAKIRMPDVPFD